MTALTNDILAAFPAHGRVDRAARLQVLRELHSFYLAYLSGPEEYLFIPRLGQDARIVEIETAWLTWEDSQVDECALPSTSDEFRDWFLAVSQVVAQPDFCAFLAGEATLPQIALLFMAEELVDTRLDDLLAMVQIGARDHMKVTMAENYWDEMGQGDTAKMRTAMFEHSARYMRNQLADAGGSTERLHRCPEVLENASLLLMYGIHRHLVLRALGAKGILEHSAPARLQASVDGCLRLGVPADVIDYHRVHVHMDRDHGDEWFRAVLAPLVAQSPELLREISLGVSTRARITDAYYTRVWDEMMQLGER